MRCEAQTANCITPSFGTQSYGKKGKRWLREPSASIISGAVWNLLSPHVMTPHRRRWPTPHPWGAKGNHSSPDSIAPQRPAWATGPGSIPPFPLYLPAFPFQKLGGKPASSRHISAMQAWRRHVEQASTSPPTDSSQGVGGASKTPCPHISCTLEFPTCLEETLEHSQIPSNPHLEPLLSLPSLLLGFLSPFNFFNLTWLDNLQHSSLLCTSWCPICAHKMLPNPNISALGCTLTAGVLRIYVLGAKWEGCSASHQRGNKLSIHLSSSSLSMTLDRSNGINKLLIYLV